MAILGKRNLLSVNRESTPGLYLDGGELGEILLPGRYIPKNLAQGQKIDVFVYRDSEDRLVATTETPNAMFLDWGLSKDLLVPFREQEFPLQPGDWVVVYVGLDPKTNRILASTRLHYHLSHDTPAYRTGQAVNMMIIGKTPLGYNAIVENAHRGLLFKNNITAALKIGAKLKGFVQAVRAGGKIDLSLDAAGYQRVAPLTEEILKALQGSGGRLEFDDDSPPAKIRLKFGVSKKAFKQALGKLYKTRRIVFLKPGIQLLPESDWSPGK